MDADFNGPFFLARFKEAFIRMSAVLESVDATLAGDCPTRPVIESVLGMELLNCVACEGSHRVIRTEKFEQWRERMRRVGFESVPLSDETVEALKGLVLGEDRRYGLAVGDGVARLSWCGTPFVFVGAWK